MVNGSICSAQLLVPPRPIFAFLLNLLGEHLQRQLTGQLILVDILTVALIALDKEEGHAIESVASPFNQSNLHDLIHHRTLEIFVLSL
jgi:hypothetical protein